MPIDLPLSAGITFRCFQGLVTQVEPALALVFHAGDSLERAEFSQHLVAEGDSTTGIYLEETACFVESCRGIGELLWGGPSRVLPALPR